MELWELWNVDKKNFVFGQQFVHLDNFDKTWDGLL